MKAILIALAALTVWAPKDPGYGGPVFHTRETCELRMNQPHSHNPQVVPPWTDCYRYEWPGDAESAPWSDSDAASDWHLVVVFPHPGFYGEFRSHHVGYYQTERDCREAGDGIVRGIQYVKAPKTPFTCELDPTHDITPN
jgi:hypothetical protein